MVFSREQFISKVQSLDETQDSIVSTSKWILTLYKEADKVATTWVEYLSKSSISTKRKLLVIYLANDIVQQAKHRQVPNFDKSFGKVLPSALEKVYVDFPSDIRSKVRRVVGIWRQRRVLSESVLDDIDKRLDAVSSKSSPGPVSGKAEKISTNSGSGKVNKKWSAISSAYDKIEQQEKAYATLRLRFDKSIEALEPNSVVYAENFNVISKIGNSVKESLTKSIGLRTDVITQLEKLITEQKDLLNKEQDSINEIDSMIMDKDPSNLNQTLAADDPDLLPTYENDDDNDDDSSSSDNDDDKSEDNKRLSNNTDDSLVGSNSEKSSSEEPNTKKQKVESSNQNPSNSSNSSTASPSKNNNNVTIASSIQDLLSRLAD
ncbi:regulator of Ty1 transposition [Kluyveromyces marxianus]|uniref:Regulator of Ty1 transposition n=2 Tax=Kluyveromyces marxianus TaxID=4911 RepID=W0T8F9_KLUMD|nr:regulator of Ty1 transposition [Kluyveromyces marxianus DMKU3-1042]QGN15424.1 regulator of Ty1 transposition [Kluyveromyces marxianus]BAO39710.1 regulator of Ty1 transposition [Kluyveromyces marxianus DMKU3-1042]BAP71194.1 regulator of Ty1 transposition [Kluyveromyces marxianus]